MNTLIEAKALHVQAKAKSIDVLELLQIHQAVPVVNPGEVLVQVHAAAINPSDVKATLGIMPHAVFPRTPGRDFAGQVVAGPSEFIGRLVWGSGGDVGITRNGSHGRYLVLPEQAAQQVPLGINMQEAGAVGVPFVTAIEGFRRAGGVQSGQTVVVFGANGKVGQAAVQLAARAGAKVIAVQRQDELAGFACQSVDVVNSTKVDPAKRIMEITDGKGADIVFNTVERVYWEAAHHCMAKGACQIFIVATKGETVPFDLFRFFRGRHSFYGIDTLALDCVRSGNLLGGVREGFEDGSLKPFQVLPSNVLDLSQAMQGYRRVFAGSAERIVLCP